METYGKMFQSSDGSFQRNWMEPHDIRMSVKATTAVVTCEQHVFARRFVRGKRRQTELINKLQATNLFRKIAGKWYLTYHHSSWHADSEVAKKALNQAMNGGGDNGESGGKGGVEKIVVKGRQTSEEMDGAIDNILGINNFGPVLGDDNDSNNENSNGGGPKRIIMGGSISDLLSGGLLGDILGDAASSSPINGGNANGDDVIEGTVIRFTNDGSENDEDDDEEEDVDENSGDDSVSRIKEWGKKSNDEGKPSQKQPLRQQCIGALRRLADQGRISPKQKRVLLTDIISQSTKREVSMVEVAYELLCVEADNDNSMDDAEEEFADQCIVFAQSIIEAQEQQQQQQQPFPPSY